MQHTDDVSQNCTPETYYLINLFHPNKLNLRKEGRKKGRKEGRETEHSFPVFTVLA